MIIKQIHVHLADIRYCNRHTLKINSVAKTKKKKTENVEKKQKKTQGEKKNAQTKNQSHVLIDQCAQVGTDDAPIIIAWMQSSNANEFICVL